MKSVEINVQKNGTPLMLSEEHPEVTPEIVLKYLISDAINRWLHEMGTKAVTGYVNYIDRVCDIGQLVEKAMEEAKERYGIEVKEGSLKLLVDEFNEIQKQQNDNDN